MNTKAGIGWVHDERSAWTVKEERSWTETFGKASLKIPQQEDGRAKKNNNGGDPLSGRVEGKICWISTYEKETGREGNTKFRRIIQKRREGA